MGDDNNPIPLPTKLNLAGLAAREGVTVKTIRHRLARGWRPTEPLPQQPMLLAHPLGKRWTWLGAILTLTAFSLAGFTVVINGQGIETMESAALAFAAGMLTIFLPSVASALWHVPHKNMAASAWILWLAVAALTAMAAVNADASESLRPALTMLLPSGAGLLIAFALGLSSPRR